MLADLHVHSTYSDGWYTPDELCFRAAARGVELISVTDHDTLAGEEVKRAAAEKHGLRYITGWEISAYQGEQKLHILGYGCALNAEYFEFMERRRRFSFLRAEESVEALKSLGVSVELSDVLAMRASADLPVHTMHVARAAARSLGISESEVYAEYLAVGKKAHSALGRPTPKEAIECIHACGGVASIAHPGRIFAGEAEREKILEALVLLGVDGIEAYYTTHTERETEYFLRFAQKHELLVTGGSDTHFEEETHKIGSPRFIPSEEFLRKTGVPCTR